MTGAQFVTLYAVAAAGQAGPPLDPDYQAYLDALGTFGVTPPTPGQQAKQNQLILDVKAAYDWSKIKSFRLYAGSNALAALVDVKRLVQMTAVNAPTYDPVTGYAGDGAASYIDTGALASALWTNNENLGYLVASPFTAGTGQYATGAFGAHVFRPSGTNFQWYAAQTAGATSVANPVLIGGTRANATDYTQYNLGAAPLVNTTPTVAPRVALNVADGAVNTSGSTYNGFSDLPLQVVIYTEALTEVEFNAVAAALQTYLTP